MLFINDNHPWQSSPRPCEPKFGQVDRYSEDLIVGSHKKVSVMKDGRSSLTRSNNADSRAGSRWAKYAELLTCPICFGISQCAVCLETEIQNLEWMIYHL